MILKLIITIILATVFPIKNQYLYFFNLFTSLIISFLFFIHGAKLSREKIINSNNHWKLHLWILCSTFIIFPFLGFLLIYWHPVNIDHDIYVGFIYLCILPATLQSSIALTSIAGGNVAAATFSASISSILGIFISPILISLVTNVQSNNLLHTAAQIMKIILQLLIPFILGHLLHYPLIAYIDKYRKIFNKIDQTSIMLIVYSAFSDAVTNGIWHRICFNAFLWILIGCLLLLFIVLIINYFAAKLLCLNRCDEIVVLFCGSKKSLANGVPMANILFPSNIVGIIVLPLMIFHQIQLIICSFIANKYKITTKK